MPLINLLPWREQKREQDKKAFTTYAMFGVLLACFLVFVFNYYALSLVDAQRTRNATLDKEIARLNKEISEIKTLKELRAALIARMTIVQELQSTRALTVRLFDELIKMTPNGVYLFKVDRVGSRVTLYGYADSNTQVSELMRNIEKIDWFQDPVLTEIKKSNEQTIGSENTFKLSFDLQHPFLMKETTR